MLLSMKMKVLSGSQVLLDKSLVLNHNAMVSKPTVQEIVKVVVMQGPVNPGDCRNFFTFQKVLWKFLSLNIEIQKIPLSGDITWLLKSLHKCNERSIE